MSFVSLQQMLNPEVSECEENLLQDFSSEIMEEPNEEVAAQSDNEIELQHQFHYFPPSDDNFNDLTELQVGLPPRPGVPAVVLMGCCPCLSNNPCSDDKKQEYRNVHKTTIFFLSIFQIVVFCLSVFIGGLAPLYDNWMIGPPGETLVRMGAKYGPLIRYRFELWRILSPIFLHAGLIQLTVNVFYQLRMGLYLEPRWGWARFMTIYFGSGSAGLALCCVTNSNTVSVAASFSMIGIMAAWFAQLHMTWETLEGWQKKMNLSVCLVVTLITLGEGIGPSYVDSAGHLGGLLMGLALGYLFFGWTSALSHEDRLLSRLIPLAGALFVLLYFFVMLGLFFTIVKVDPLPESVDEVSPIDPQSSNFTVGSSMYESSTSYFYESPSDLFTYLDSFMTRSAYQYASNSTVFES
mmetsp:Transcript_1316/g.1688  ORF Transcript_1316/g.1688 Transcript_1316/m.1688 type:complete len:408 (-) Transcript_1316:53-1276(-)